MVFGRTHCTVSHLPIDDGDHCILVPLGFCMKKNFGEYDPVSISDFEWLYVFHSEAVEVVYGGNPQEIQTLDGKEYRQFKSYMLLRKDVWHAIQDSFAPDHYVHHVGLRPEITLIQVWEKSNEARDHLMHDDMVKVLNGKMEREHAFDRVAKFEVPRWMTELYRLNHFMGKMGIPPHPMVGIDQSRDAGKAYWKVIDKCRKNKGKAK